MQARPAVPDDAIAVLGTGLLSVFAFVMAMLAGMALHARIGKP